MYRIVALDPGRTTGVCLVDVGKKDFTLSLQETKFTIPELATWLDEQMPDLVIYETFQYRRVPNADLFACEIIGALKYWTSVHSRELVGQGPSTKTLWDDKKLAILYSEHAKKTPHANDAYRHLLYWACLDNKAEGLVIRKWALEALRYAQEPQSNTPAPDPLP